MTTTRKTFVTPATAAIYDFYGPNPGCEAYFSPDQSEGVTCTTQEREDFETETERALTADVIEDRDDYDALVRWLVENCDLQRTYP